MDTDIITLDETKENIEYIRNIFKKSNLKLNSQCHLEKLFISLEKVNKEITPLQMIESLDIKRVYDALLSIESLSAEKKKPILKRLRKGKLDFGDYKEDDGKSVLFELEVASSFIKSDIEVHFEEPDLVVNLDNKKVGIACKKIHSLKSLQKAVKKAEKQISNNGFEYGIIAINFDNMYPENSLLNAPTRQGASDYIHEKNLKIYKENKKIIDKCFNKESAHIVLLNSSIKTDVKNETPNFNNLSQNLFILSKKANNESLNKSIKEIFR